MKKKKTIWFIVLFVLLLVGLFLLCFFVNKKEKEQKKMEEIIDHYGKVVQVMEDTALYEREEDTFVPVGIVYKDQMMKLDKLDVRSENDIYFKVQGEPFYILYQTVEGKEAIDEKSTLLFEEKIITKEEATFYKKGVKAFTLNTSVEVQIIEKKDDSYMVQFGYTDYEILKSDIEEVVPTEKMEQVLEEEIPVLHYSNIDQKTLEEQLLWLEDANRETLTFEEWEKWHDEKVLFAPSHVLLLFDVVDQNLASFLKEKGYSYTTISETGLTPWVHKNTYAKVEDKEKVPTFKMTPSLTKEEFTRMLSHEIEPMEEESIFADKVAVLNYHFFYDGNVGNNCGETICLDSRKFEQHLTYLKEEGFKTVTMEEYRAWMYGEINLPKKSVLLTIDDGAAGTSKINGNILIPMLEKYDLHATLFLITAWWDLANYQSDHLDVESHGYDIHISQTCNGTSKARALCLNKAELLDDFQKSIAILNTKIAFCYPFYAYNNTVVEAVKESGFQLGFVGGNTKSKRSNNKYLIPRYIIYDSITQNQFINMVS